MSQKTLIPIGAGLVGRKTIDNTESGWPDFFGPRIETMIDQAADEIAELARWLEGRAPVWQGEETKGEMKAWDLVA